MDSTAIMWCSGIITNDQILNLNVFWACYILNAKNKQIPAILYVSSSGDDSNTGLSPFEPLLTIEQAMKRIYTDEQKKWTIFLANGVYGPSTSGESGQIKFRDNVTLSGASAHNTILDEVNLSLYFNTNIIIENLSIRNNNSSGIYIACSKNIEIKNLIVSNNTRTSHYGWYLFIFCV